MSAQKTHQSLPGRNLCGLGDMKAEQMRRLGTVCVTWGTRPAQKRSAVCSYDQKSDRCCTSGDLCDPCCNWDQVQTLPVSTDTGWVWFCSRLVIIKDGVLNQLPPWDSLCSQQWVMSVPRALKLTVIRALKAITKQQELAHVSGGRVVMVDGVMFARGKKIEVKGTCACITVLTAPASLLYNLSAVVHDCCYS